MKPYVLIIGAKGDIAKEIAKVYASNGFNLILSGRKITELEEFCKELEELSIKVILKELDITKFDTFSEFISTLDPFPFGLIIATGFNPDNLVSSTDTNKFLEVNAVNYIGPILFINQIKDKISTLNNSFIIGISSVAGERGRQKNYIYGSAKSGFSTYLSGLRQDLNSTKTNVITVHPGFVRTKMTENIKTIGFLTALPSQIALDIFKGQQSNKSIIYTRFYWKYIMLIIKSIPESIFKKLNL